MRFVKLALSLGQKRRLRLSSAAAMDANSVCTACNPQRIAGECSLRSDESHATLVVAPILRFHQCFLRFRVLRPGLTSKALNGGNRRCRVKIFDFAVGSRQSRPENPKGFQPCALDAGFTLLARYKSATFRNASFFFERALGRTPQASLV